MGILAWIFFSTVFYGGPITGRLNFVQATLTNESHAPLLEAAGNSETTLYFLSDAYIEKINAEQDQWQAGRNFPVDMSWDKLKVLAGTRLDGQRKRLFSVKSHDPEWPPLHKVPRKFDARKKWPKCKTTSEVLDQGLCGSCWAISTAQAFTDRFCIASKGKHTQRLSTDDVLTCCDDCGHGCKGGWESEAWQYFSNRGAVSGGNYSTSDGCKPYSIMSPCNYGNKNGHYFNCTEYSVTPECHTHCTNHKYKKDISKDGRFGKGTYYLRSDPSVIKRDIMTHGPITVAFMMYDDFYHYKKGVYEPNPKAEKVGGHAVKCIGWGVEKKIPYWLIMNSWNELWGDHGLIKMKANSPKIRLENEAFAAIPDLHRKK